MREYVRKGNPNTTHPYFLSTQNSDQNDMSAIVNIFERMVQIVEEKSQTESSLVLTVKDAAEMLQISIPSLRDHFLCRPDFPKIRVGSKILIPRKALEDWINGQS
ncbi:helix-turn-helix domain-containing protein [Baia soyae]|uniref:Helix-turn-helix protein n=1 Tax=Baia soyae TaxID=1544746 RepID=A0A4V2SW69_9BACL|nr:helix-turn-helix domain-containing protein [Baia soyae]TCP61246.1 helix-turn-helix protein [Baia soyae]